MKIQKRHIALAALIVALGAAVYLNWQFSDSAEATPSSKELGAATYVSADAKSTDDNASTVSKTQTKTDDYFSKAATDRKKTQDRVLSEAKNVLALSDSSDDAKEEASRQLSKLEDRILSQSNIENVLLAKGFSRCLCFISDEGCTVAVVKNELKTISPLVVKDAVTSQSDVDFNEIQIIEV